MEIIDVREATPEEIQEREEKEAKTNLAGCHAGEAFERTCT